MLAFLDGSESTFGIETTKESQMGTKQIMVLATQQFMMRRFSVTSSKLFEDVVSRLEAATGHPDMSIFRRDVASAKTYPDLQKVVQGMIGTSGLMEFSRIDMGEVMRRDRAQGTPRSLRLTVGNPLIMKQMVEHAPDAGLYAAVTILIDERPDGVHLSYDTMSDFLSSYRNPEALRVAQDLDWKVQAMLTAAAGSK
jgi:uncharacterized protein (DUF302 family)